MTITICLKSALSGLFMGVILTASAWYGAVLVDRTEITQALLAQAKCDPAGFVAITFIDASQFTCVPAKYTPPTSRSESAQRARGRS